MNIQNEIEQLEKQINSLKKKQQENNARRRIVNHGDVYHNHNVDYKVIVVCLDCNKWGYTFSDGTGKLFDSKIQLEDCLAQAKFSYLGTKINF